MAPRLGFAWNVTGDGRTAIRGGAGAYYDRYAENDILELLELPPLVRTYTANYTTIAELKNDELKNDVPTETATQVQPAHFTAVDESQVWPTFIHRRTGPAEPGSPEARLYSDFLRPRDWAGEAPS